MRTLFRRAGLLSVFVMATVSLESFMAGIKLGVPSQFGRVTYTPPTLPLATRQALPAVNWKLGMATTKPSRSPQLPVRNIC